MELSDVSYVITAKGLRPPVCLVQWLIEKKCDTLMALNLFRWE